MAGEKGQFRYGFETAEGVPDHRLSFFTRFQTESFDTARPPEPDPNLDPSGNETEGDNLKAEGTGTLSVAPNTESLLPMRIHQHGFYVYNSPEAGVHDYELRDYDELTDTPIAHYVDSLHFGVWRDERTNPSEYAGNGMKVTESTISVEANKFVKWDHSALFLRDRYMSNPLDIAVNVAFTGDWIAFGHRPLDDENGDPYKFKISTPGALGVAKIQWAKGAGAYGVTEYLITDDWMPVMNADGTEAGTPEEPLRIRLIPGGVFTLADEWQITATAAKPTPVYSNRPKLAATRIELRFSLNGGTTWRTYNIDSWSLKHGTPREAKFGVGSKYAYEIGKPDTAKNWWELSFARTYVDRELKQALISQRVISAYAKMYGGPIGATGERDYSEFTLDRMKFGAAGATIGNAGDLKENPTLRAFSENLSPLCVEKHRTTIASVVPA